MSFPGSLQYQRLAEPVVAPPLDTGESVFLDKWNQQRPDPTRRRRNVAIIAPFIAFVNFAAVAPVESITIDMWRGQTIEPTLRRERCPDLQSFTIDQFHLLDGETVTLNKWFVRGPDPTRRNPRAAFLQPVTIDPFHLLDGETVTLDKWFSRGPDPTRRKPRAAFFQSFGTDSASLLNGETVTIDKWMGFEEVPNRRLKPRLSDPARDPLQDPLAAEVINLDKWFGQRPDPTRRSRRSAWFIPFTIDPARLLDGETVTLDKWTGSAEIPSLRLRPRFPDQERDPLQAIVAAESVTLDKWLNQRPDPTRRSRRSAWFMPFAIDASHLLARETITPDKWLGSFEIPSRRQRQRISDQGRDPLQEIAGAEEVTIDKWIGSGETPTRRRLQARVGEFEPFFVVGDVDKWAPQLPEMFRVRRGSIAAQFFAFTERDIAPPEVITLDKWWQAASEPKRLGKKISARYIQSWERTELTIVPIVWTTYGGPFLYTAANWSTSTEFFFEAYFRASVGTCRARLVNQAGTAVGGSEVTTSSATHVRLRSSAVTLVDGSEYFAQFGEETGATGFFLLARVIGI